MKKYIYSLIIFLIIGCGSGSETQKIIGDYFKYQWNINPNSIYYDEGKVTRGADINLSPAWQYNKGDGVTVAVIESCFDTTHEDLRDNIYLAYNVETKKLYQNGENCQYMDKDEKNHGNQVAGVIAGVENGFGITGVSPKVKLILISVFLSNTDESNLLYAFDYAKSHGAKVINCSWGSGYTSQPLSDKLEEMKNSGITVVFSSGNDAKDLDKSGIDDESENQSVIGVGATDETNDVAYYSNYGSNIDILAPGGDYIGIYTTKDDNKYEKVKGTSFSAPTVSGVVALMYAKDPTLTFDEIYQKLTQSADKIGIENGATYINGFDTYRAYGKINAGNALNQ